MRTMRDLSATIFFIAATAAVIYVCIEMRDITARMRNEMDAAAARHEQSMRDHLIFLEEHERVMQQLSSIAERRGK